MKRFFNLFSIFSLLFSIEDVPEDMQIKILLIYRAIQYFNKSIKTTLKFQFLFKICRHRDNPYFRNNALKIISLFYSTYIYNCEHNFSRIKIFKSKTWLTDINLENSLMISSSHIQPNIEKLVSKKQCQYYHTKNRINDL